MLHKRGSKSKGETAVFVHDYSRMKKEGATTCLPLSKIDLVKLVGFLANERRYVEIFGPWCHHRPR